MEVTGFCSNFNNVFAFDAILGAVLYGIFIIISISLPYILICGICTKIEACHDWCGICKKIEACHDWWTTNVVERVFDIFLDNDKKEEEVVYYISNLKAPSNFTLLLSILLIQMIAVAAVQFCDDFFVEESRDCVTHGFTCCFSLDSRPVFDCSNTSYLEDNNFTSDSIICYRFVLHLGTATGSALGVVTTTALIVYLITKIILKVSRASVHRKCYTIIVKSIIMLLTAILTFGYCAFQSSAHSSPAKILNAINEISPIGNIIFWYTFWFPWKKFETISDNGDSEMYRRLS